MTLANDRGYALTIAQRFFYERNVTLDVVFGVLLGIMTTVGVLGIIRGVRIAISQRRDERRRAGGV